MYPSFHPSQILRTTGDYELGHTLYGFAAEFAVLGGAYLDTARELISLASKQTPLRRVNTPVFKPLWLVWDLTGTWPEGEEALVHLEQEQEQEQSAADPGDQEGKGHKRKRDAVAELAEQYEMGRWETAGFEKKGEQVNDETRLRGCVEKLRGFAGEGSEWAADATTGGMAMSKSSILVKALEIAVVLRGQGQEQGDSHAGEGLPAVDEILGWIAERLHANQMIVYLTQSAKAWEVLKDGALAKAIGVKDEKVQELGCRVLETFRTRYEKGVQRSGMWDKSVAELVQIISHNTANNEAAKSYRYEMYGVEEEEKSGGKGDGGKHLTTILKDPLSRNDIAALEKRLDISLPDDYKDFLAATDGMGASWGGIIVDPPLFAGSEVRWITEEEEYFTDLAADIFPDIFDSIRDIYDDEEWPTVGMPLEIGSYDIFEVWLLPPPKVKELVAIYLDQRERGSEIKALIKNAITAWAGSLGEFENLEWCVMTWVSGGVVDMQAYPSFKAFLVNKAEASADDYRMETPEQVCFSYSCR
jgi:hypothetical protein